MSSNYNIQQKRVVTASIAAGMLLYLSKFLRPYIDSQPVLFVLGFLPNVGLAFALPFIYVGNRMRLQKSINHFTVICFITFLLMLLNEIRDKYQAGRVFDYRDIYASAAGVVFSYILFTRIFLRMRTY